MKTKLQKLRHMFRQQGRDCNVIIIHRYRYYHLRTVLRTKQKVKKAYVAIVCFHFFKIPHVCSNQPTYSYTMTNNKQ